MNKLRILLSLPNQNHYQLAQSQTAKRKSQQLNIEIEVLHADNDAVNQSQQLLKVLQSPSTPRPDAILVEPLTSTALEKVGESAIASGVAWVLLNSNADYIDLFRRKTDLPVFAVTRDHTEIGRIQGKQFAALLPYGGTVLYLQGPNTSAAATERKLGVDSVKPSNLSLRLLRSQWTEESAKDAVRAWLKLSTSRPESIDLVGCQYDGIARGARLAFQEVASSGDRVRWLSIPCTGVDGLVDEGQSWVNAGELTATVVAPITTEIAIDQLAKALRTGVRTPPVTLLELKSYPSLEKLSDLGRAQTGRGRDAKA